MCMSLRSSRILNRTTDNTFSKRLCRDIHYIRSNFKLPVIEFNDNSGNTENVVDLDIGPSLTVRTDHDQSLYTLAISEKEPLVEFISATDFICLVIQHNER